MTAAVKGKTRAEAEQLFDQFHDLVTGKLAEPDQKALGSLRAFAGVVAISAPREMRESRLARDAFGARRRASEPITTDDASSTARPRPKAHEWV